jgi:hypothetical protein
MQQMGEVAVAAVDLRLVGAEKLNIQALASGGELLRVL